MNKVIITCPFCNNMFQEDPSSASTKCPNCHKVLTLRQAPPPTPQHQHTPPKQPQFNTPKIQQPQMNYTQSKQHYNNTVGDLKTQGLALTKSSLNVCGLHIIFVIANVVLMLLHWFTVPVITQLGSFFSDFTGLEIGTSPNFSIFNVANIFSDLGDYGSADQLQLIGTVLTIVPIVLLGLFALLIYFKISKKKNSNLIGFAAYGLSITFCAVLFIAVGATNSYINEEMGGFSEFIGDIVQFSIFFYIFIIVNILAIIVTLRERSYTV